MADESIEDRFKKAVWLIRNGPKMDSTNEQKLTFYSYFKQATKGDVEGTQPWAVQIEARAKWDWWAKLKGMSKEEAMQHYIDLLGDPEIWENHELLKSTYKPAEFDLAKI
ncbi:ACBP-domain-containing protein [Coccomyxa subellipsoidea C-169]|uniref:ACBP-domain-containing protein n=1 Tax=Coccomyxa subellipsoidea (strain C-169) TaxID=574566 RepID=I0YNV0_COCSC|nr:ACBP-domain-containing protein [Coccomyxa subellipsoidea C-169]EIE20069.1 ACBP-domain-containing protein [Coccomyxa subellipsoidea C-169]|eukprot:XP_005644613.1 ACBP-domain-containing protein [Coccomyxa subellipsoidea C-169]